LRRDRKTSNEGAEVTCWGKLFQMQAAAVGKARSPTVDSRVWPTISCEDEVLRDHGGDSDAVTDVGLSKSFSPARQPCYSDDTVQSSDVH